MQNAPMMPMMMKLIQVAANYVTDDLIYDL